MKLTETIQFSTPAKVNFFLSIQNKRPDGYHELLMDLVPISLFDSFELSPCSENRVELSTNMKGVPMEENLIVKAIRLLEKRSGKNCSLTIQQTKNIPSGAGLGGGSGNAAGFLVVLNRYFRLGFSDSELRTMALSLGADVPFFIDPRPAIARGIGEQLTFLPEFQPLHLLLISPGFPISTGEAYAQCHISGNKVVYSDYSPEAFKQHKPERNDFWPALVDKYDALEQCRSEILKTEGAIAAGMSGSGSTLYGVYKDRKSRDQAHERLQGANSDWKPYSCETMSRYDYTAGTSD